LAERAGDVPAAIALYDRARESDPSDAEPGFAAAELVAGRGDRAQAIDRLVAVLRIDPRHARAALRLADLLAQEPIDLDRAQDFAQRAVALGGGVGALEALGRVRVMKGDGERAVANLREAQKLDPDRPSVQYWLGRALALTGDDAGARDAYERVVESGSGPEVERARAELAARGGGEGR
jgi:tetratricopeptide (TPR) repeat protein